MEENMVQDQPIEIPVKPAKPWLKIILFLVLGLVLAGGLVWAGMQIGKSSKLKTQISKPQLKAQNLTPTQTPINTPTPPPYTPETITENFYKWYMDCWIEHQEGVVQGDASKDCLYKNSEYVSSELSQNLPIAHGSDPIMCAQDFPVRITVDKAVVTGTDANVIAHHIYEASGDNPITVNLKFIEGTWKISNITCPKR